MFVMLTAQVQTARDVAKDIGKSLDDSFRSRFTTTQQQKFNLHESYNKVICHPPEHMFVASRNVLEGTT